MTDDNKQSGHDIKDVVQPTGVAIVGTGLWGAQHARVFDALPQTRLVALCDLDQAAAQRLVSQYSAEFVTTDFEAVLAHPDIEAVSIATPDFSHATLITDALAAGKHVLTEKPLATDLEEALAIKAAAEKSDRILMVDFHNRVNPVFASARDSVAAGELGTLAHGSARLSNTTFVPLEMLGWASRTSALWFLGSHAVDILRFVLDDEIVRVYARRGQGILKSRGVDTYDFHLSMLEFSQGTVVTLENSWLLSPDNPMVFDLRVELVGSAGQVQLDPSHNGAFRKLTGSGMKYGDMFGITPTGGDRIGGFVLESIARFIDSVRHGTPVLASASDGVAATRVLSAIETSAASGRAVDL